VARRIVPSRYAQSAKDHTGRHVAGAQRGADPASVALHDEHVAIDPETVGQPGQQWADRRVDAVTDEIGSHVGGERASVDQYGYRSSRWEKRHVGRILPP
jgi:hypothetical protein